MKSWLRTRMAWWTLLALGLLPLFLLLWYTLTEQLGANPAETLIRDTGHWTLRGLCLSLSMTPLRTVLNWPELARFRRMAGLLTFGYACLHLLCYAWLDMGFEAVNIAQDIAKRPFIWLGFSAFVILLTLAATSFNRAVRWLGSQRWQALHRSVYAVAMLAILHFWWMRSGKQNFDAVLVYACLLSCLLGWRLTRLLWRRIGTPAKTQQTHHRS